MNVLYISLMYFLSTYPSYSVGFSLIPAFHFPVLSKLSVCLVYLWRCQQVYAVNSVKLSSPYRRIDFPMRYPCTMVKKGERWYHEGWSTRLHRLCTCIMLYISDLVLPLLHVHVHVHVHVSIPSSSCAVHLS